MNEGCLFCGIVAGDIPANVIAESEEWVAFRDIHPQAPTHVLVVPRRHVAGVDRLEAGDSPLAGVLVAAAAEIARDEGLVDGYRLVFNVGAGAGQTVHHIHLHLLGGRGFSWPPG